MSLLISWFAHLFSVCYQSRIYAYMAYMHCTLCNCANAHIAWHGNGARHKSPKSCQRPGIPAASTADNLDPQVSTAILSSCVSPTIEVHWLGSLPLYVLSFSHSNCKTWVASKKLPRWCSLLEYLFFCILGGNEN